MRKYEDDDTLFGMSEEDFCKGVNAASAAVARIEAEQEAKEEARRIGLGRPKPPPQLHPSIQHQNDYLRQQSLSYNWLLGAGSIAATGLLFATAARQIGTKAKGVGAVAATASVASFFVSLQHRAKADCVLYNSMNVGERWAREEFNRIAPDI